MLSLRTMQVFFEWSVWMQNQNSRDVLLVRLWHMVLTWPGESAREFPLAIEEQRSEGISRHMIVLKIAILGKQWQNFREKQRCVHE